MEKECFSSKVVVRLRPLSSGERDSKATAALRCAQPTQCGKGLVLSGLGNASPSTTATATATTPPTAAAAAFASNANDSSSSFSFPDGVLGEGASQREAYEVVSEVVEGVLLGKSASIVAYGQTGAGKTHTLFGGEDDPGIAARALSSLCRALVASGGKAAGASLTLSAVEIYCDKVRCLLAKGTAGAGGAGGTRAGAVTVGASAADGGVALQGAAAREVDLSSAPAASGSVSALLSEVGRARVVASTGMNDASSRSHAVIIATVIAPTATKTGPSSTSSSSSSSVAAAATATRTRAIATKARLALVDLAGSERASRAHAGSAAGSVVAAEGRAINASLTALGKVVAALAEEAAAGGGFAAAGSLSPSSGSPSSVPAAPPSINRIRSSSSSSSSGGGIHIPYRDSSLTRVLRDCLDGSSRAAFLICASPAAADARETLGSLRFGSRARGLVAAVQVGAVQSSIPAPRTPAEEEETRREARAKKSAAARERKTIGGATPPPGRRCGGGENEEGEEAQLATSSACPAPRLFSSLSSTQRGAVAALLSAAQLAAVLVLVQQGK